MISYEEWRIAYAKQSLADLRARERLLEHSDLPDCQQLHFLQMACEKLCKAHLLRARRFAGHTAQQPCLHQ